MSSAATGPARTNVPWVAGVIDAVAIIVFAIVGRASHTESLGVAGVWQTAWPFLVGGAVGWLITAVVARGGDWQPAGLFPAGVIIWLSTVIGGMTLRAVTGTGTALPFVIVATIATAVLLLGRRLIVRLQAGSRLRSTG